MGDSRKSFENDSIDRSEAFGKLQLTRAVHVLLRRQRLPTDLCDCRETLVFQGTPSTVELVRAGFAVAKPIAFPKLKRRDFEERPDREPCNFLVQQYLLSK